MNILDKPVSIFANYNTPSNPKTTTIRHFLTSTKYREVVQRIRAIEDKAERDKLKATLPAITPSGVFSYRAADCLLNHSGLICLDIDYKGNEKIENFFELKEQLIKIPNVAFCIKSVSGAGYAVGIPIAYPERHGQHFDALKRIFWGFGLVLDKACCDVSRLRGYSYDPDVYLNEKAKVFALCDEPKKVVTKYVQRSRTSYTQQNDPLAACLNIIQNSNNGERHHALLKSARLAGGYIAAGLLDEAQAVDELENEFGRREFDRHYKPSRTIRDGIAYGKLQPIREQFAAVQIDQPLGYPKEWDDPGPVGYVPTWVEHTPQSLGLIQATAPPMTEQDLINIFENNKHLQE
ncbi:BT4734/BF3469 family protein [Runella sp.]|uniref:BT4734/BF3469 family protein n=1 Tax=Runella sp. TaxID=1960881 RepID=UPI003016E8E3